MEKVMFLLFYVATFWNFVGGAGRYLALLVGQVTTIVLLRS